VSVSRKELITPVPTDSRGTQAGEGRKAWNSWLAAIIKVEGSDLIVKAGLPPRIRFRGALKDLTSPPVTEDLMFQVAKDILDPNQLDHFRRNGSMDFAFDFDQGRRFRVNLFMARGRPAVAARLIGRGCPTDYEPDQDLRGTRAASEPW